MITNRADQIFKILKNVGISAYEYYQILVIALSRIMLPLRSTDTEIYMHAASCYKMQCLAPLSLVYVGGTDANDGDVYDDD